MMKIQALQSERACTLKVEGEIAGVAADELEKAWRELTFCASPAVTIDFTGVIHIDRRARKLLRSMHESGVKFTSADMAIQDILEEIIAPGTFVDNKL